MGDLECLSLTLSFRKAERLDWAILADKNAAECETALEMEQVPVLTE